MPPSTNVVLRAKWDNWTSCMGMTREKALFEYVAVVQKIQNQAAPVSVVDKLEKSETPTKVRIGPPPLPTSTPPPVPRPKTGPPPLPTSTPPPVPSTTPPPVLPAHLIKPPPVPVVSIHSSTDKPPHNSANHDELVSSNDLRAWIAATKTMQDTTAALSYRVTAHDKTLDVLVSQSAEMPRLMWFYPKERRWRDWLKKPGEMLCQNTLMLVFVCPVTLETVRCGPNGDGWELKHPKEFFRKYGFAILLSIRALRLALFAGKVLGIPLPNVIPSGEVVEKTLGLTDGISKCLANEALAALQDVVSSDSICAGIDEVDASLRETLSTEETVDKSKQKEIVKLSGDVYTAIHKFLTTGDNKELGPLRDQLEGSMERVTSPFTGVVEWVSVEGKETWLKQQEKIHLDAAHHNTSAPPVCPGAPPLPPPPPPRDSATTVTTDTTTTATTTAAAAAAAAPNSLQAWLWKHESRSN